MAKLKQQFVYMKDMTFFIPFRTISFEKSSLPF